MTSAQYGKVDDEVDEPETLRLRSILTSKLMWSDEQLQQAQGKVEMGRAIAPVLGTSQLANILMLASQLLTLFLVKQYAVCSNDGQAAYPIWIWLTNIPLVLLRLGCEIRAVTAFLPVYVQKIGLAGTPFKVAGMAIGSTSWLAAYLGFSTSNVADGTTDSFFTGTTLASFQCDGQQLSGLYESMWKQSLAGQHGVPAPSLFWIVLCIFALSMVQTVWPILTTLGFKAFKDENHNEKMKGLCGELGYPEGVSMTLAEGAGMATLQSLATPMTEASCKGWSPDIEVHALPLAKATLSRVGLSYILENALQLNLQILLYAINSFIAGKQWTSSQKQALFSIALGLFTASTKLIEINAFLKFAKSENVLKSIKKCEDLDDGEVDEIEASWQKACRSFAWYVLGVQVGCLILLISIIYGVCKLVAVAACEDSMWNITTGCVDMGAQ